MYFLHASRPRPALGCAEEGIRHIIVVNKIHETKPGMFLFPYFVRLVIDNPTNPPHDLVPPVREEVRGIAVFKGRVLTHRKRIPLVVNQRGYKIFISLVQVDAELDEFSQVIFRVDFFDNN